MATSYSKLRGLVIAGMMAASAVVLQATFSEPVYAQQAAQAEGEQSGQRQPPPTRSSDTLSDRVYRAIAEIQALMTPEDPADEPDLVSAKTALDDLNERYDTLNDFEKSTLLNFYTNYYLATDDIPNAMATFERILEIVNLREDARLRALLSLGQLYASEERYDEAVATLNRWRELSVEENATVFQILALAYYNKQDYPQAIPHLISHMDMLRAEGRELGKNIYGLLNLMYIELEDYENALAVTRTMVGLFDEASDWRNLAAIYGYLEDDPKRVQTLELTYRKGYFASEGDYLNLAQSLAGMDAPVRGIKILEDGIEKAVVEENDANLRRLTQMYIMASEFVDALEPAQRLTELANDGESWDYLGYVYLMNRDYANAATAMQTALERGGLENRGEVQLSLARALVELDRFDEALAAAESARAAGQNNAGQFVTFVQSSKDRHAALQARKEESIAYYRPR
jgi:lipopolysaccharide biosynthesis regulator YciM